LWLFPKSEDQDLFRDYLAATLSLQEPLPLHEFSLLTDLPIPLIENIQTDLKALQIRKTGDGHVSQMVYPAGSLLHLSFLEYLESTSTPQALAFHMTSFDSHSKLAERCLKELPLFLPLPQHLTSRKLAPRQRYTVKYLPTHIHHGTPGAMPGAAVEWRNTAHCVLLERLGFRVLGQWRDLFVGLVSPNGGGVDSWKEEYTDGEAVLVMLDVDTVLKTLGTDTAIQSFRVSCLEVVVRVRPDDMAGWYNLGWAYWETAHISKSIEASERAVAAYENALAIVEETNDTARVDAVFCALATSLNTRFDLLGNTPDLDRTIPLHRRALELRPPGNPARPISLNNLSRALLFRFTISRLSSDLDEAIRLMQGAVDTTELGDPYTSLYLTNLAYALRIRFVEKGILGDLNKAIGLLKNALDLSTRGDVDGVSALEELATILSYRCAATGSIDDIDEAIRLQREVLELSPPGDTNRGASLNAVAWSLISRYEAQGLTGNLDEAIRLSRESLSLRPVGHPERCITLDTLARALLYNPKTLDEALHLSRASISLITVGNPTRWQYLMTLAMILLRLYERSGESDQIQEALSTCKKALSISPKADPDRVKLVALNAKLLEMSAARGELDLKHYLQLF
jgi:tetratricopeptide (TPR) repeat protein